MSYWPQTYGPARSSAVFNIVSVWQKRNRQRHYGQKRYGKNIYMCKQYICVQCVFLCIVCVFMYAYVWGSSHYLLWLTSENSNAALSTNSFSDQTLDLGPISLSTNQSTETLFTCCRWHDDVSEQVRQIPALQSSNHDGNQVRRHGHLRSNRLYFIDMQVVHQIHWFINRHLLPDLKNDITHHHQ